MAVFCAWRCPKCKLVFTTGDRKYQRPKCPTCEGQVQFMGSATKKEHRNEPDTSPR